MSGRLDTNDRLIIIGLTFLFCFGIFLMGKGFTGMYLIDFEQEECSTNEGCPAEQACCYFYKEDYGVCDKTSNCKAIELITKEEKERISSSLYLEEEYKFTEEDKLRATKQISSHLEKPTTQSNYASIAVGAMLLILGIIWIIYLKKE